jgi:hypothetical protein
MELNRRTQYAVAKYSAAVTNFLHTAPLSANRHKVAVKAQIYLLNLAIRAGICDAICEKIPTFDSPSTFAIKHTSTTELYPGSERFIMGHVDSIARALHHAEARISYYRDHKAKAHPEPDYLMERFTSAVIWLLHVGAPKINRHKVAVDAQHYLLGIALRNNIGDGVGRKSPTEDSPSYYSLLHASGVSIYPDSAVLVLQHVDSIAQTLHLVESEERRFRLA